MHTITTVYDSEHGQMYATEQAEYADVSAYSNGAAFTHAVRKQDRYIQHKFVHLHTNFEVGFRATKLA